MKTQYIAIAALLSAAIIDEMASLRDIEVNDGIGSDFQREKMRNLHNARMTIEAIGAGYAGADTDEEQEVSQERSASGLEAAIDAMMSDMVRGGLGVMRIDPSELFKTEPKTGEAKPPSENKAQTAAHEAGSRTSGEANG